MLARLFRRGQEDGYCTTVIDARDFAAVLTSAVIRGILDWADNTTGRSRLVTVLAPRTELVLRGTMHATTQ